MEASVEYCSDLEGGFQTIIFSKPKGNKYMITVKIINNNVPEDESDEKWTTQRFPFIRSKCNKEEYLSVIKEAIRVTLLWKRNEWLLSLRNLKSKVEKSDDKKH